MWSSGELTISPNGHNFNGVFIIYLRSGTNRNIILEPTTVAFNNYPTVDAVIAKARVWTADVFDQIDPTVTINHIDITA